MVASRIPIAVPVFNLTFANIPCKYWLPIVTDGLRPASLRLLVTTGTSSVRRKVVWDAVRENVAEFDGCVFHGLTQSGDKVLDAAERGSIVLWYDRAPFRCAVRKNSGR